MHAAIGDQSHQVQSASLLAGMLERRHNHRMPEEFARPNQIVDARDVHVHHAARADVQVAHFAIAHLAIGQADEMIRSMKQRVRKLRQQLVVRGFTGQRNRIGELLRTVTPAIQNRQHYRLFRRHIYSPAFTAARPRNSAPCPSSSSTRSSWLYVAIRSVPEAEPVLIWPTPVATARSAMKLSSVSPLRCEMTEVYP